MTQTLIILGLLSIIIHDHLKIKKLKKDLSDLMLEIYNRKNKFASHLDVKIRKKVKL